MTAAGLSATLDDMTARAESAERNVEVLRAAVEAALPLLVRIENGHHYCRYCAAGTHNDWSHETTCHWRAHAAEVELAKEKCVRALTMTES